MCPQVRAGCRSLVAERAHNPAVVGSNPTPATITYLCGKPLRLTCEHETRVVRCERNAGHPVSAPHHWELDEVPTCPMTYSYMLD